MIRALTHFVVCLSLLAPSLLLAQPGPEPEALPEPVPGAAERPLAITVQKPGDREFVRDLANIIDDADEKAIRQLADKLLTERATPIIVITIDSMAAHGGGGLRIETFARLLFDQWGVGVAKVGDQVWNTGILLIVSKNDRKARIELGGGWGREKDSLCQKIMDEQIIPQFKAQRYSAGILAGVTALDQMARGKALPAPTAPPRPTWHYLLMAGGIGLAIFTVVSLMRNGSSGWAWIFWGVVLAIVGTIIYQLITNAGKKSGGGYSGGSFGGGFSGGGGASGSW